MKILSCTTICLPILGTLALFLGLNNATKIAEDTDHLAAFSPPTQDSSGSSLKTTGIASEKRVIKSLAKDTETSEPRTSGRFKRQVDSSTAVIGLRIVRGATPRDYTRVRNTALRVQRSVRRFRRSIDTNSTELENSTGEHAADRILQIRPHPILYSFKSASMNIYNPKRSRPTKPTRLQSPPPVLVKVEKVPSETQTVHYHEQVPSKIQTVHYHEQVPSKIQTVHYHEQVPSKTQPVHYHEQVPSKTEPVHYHEHHEHHAHPVHQVLVPVYIPHKVKVPVKVVHKVVTSAPYLLPTRPTTTNFVTITQRVFNTFNFNFTFASRLQNEFLIQTLQDMSAGLIDKNQVASNERFLVINDAGITCPDVCDTNESEGVGYGTIGICTPNFCQCDFSLWQFTQYNCPGDTVFDPILKGCSDPKTVILCNDVGTNDEPEGYGGYTGRPATGFSSSNAISSISTTISRPSNSASSNDINSMLLQNRNKKRNNNRQKIRPTVVSSGTLSYTDTQVGRPNSANGLLNTQQLTTTLNNINSVASSLPNAPSTGFNGNLNNNGNQLGFAQQTTQNNFSPEQSQILSAVSAQIPSTNFAASVNQMVTQEIATAAQFGSLPTSPNGAQFGGQQANGNGAQFGGQADDNAAQFVGLQANGNGAPFMGLQANGNGAQFGGLQANGNGAQFGGLQANDNGAQFSSLSGTFNQNGALPPQINANQLRGLSAGQDPNQYTVAAAQELFSFSQVEPSNPYAVTSDQDFVTHITSTAQPYLNIPGLIPPVATQTDSVYAQPSQAALSSGTNIFAGQTGHLTGEQIQQLKDMAKYFVAQNSLPILPYYVH